MNLYIILVISAIFLIVNFCISDRDVINPSFIFCAVNNVYLIICCFNKNLFGVDISESTVLILAVGMAFFTITNIFFTLQNKKRLQRQKYTCRIVNVNKGLIEFFYISMVVTAIILARHIKTIAAKYGAGGNLATSIGIYDNIAKFTNESVGMPTIVSIIVFPLKAAAYIFAAIIVNNYFVTKKIDKYLSIYCVGYLFFSLMHGGRSEIVRFLMAIFINAILIRRRIQGTYKKGNIRVLFRIIVFSVSIVIVSFPLLNLIGKGESLKTNAPLLLLYKYLGGPIYNLNAALSSGVVRSSLWGQETFQGIYSLLGSLFGIKRFTYRLHIPTSFVGGIDLGNVYTMYYMFFEDFGYVGMLLVIPICIYYFSAYERLLDFSMDRTPLSINMFVYSYMFNALVMLLFSNRFYENMFSYNFLKFFISLHIVWYLVRRTRARFKRTNIRLVYRG